MWRSPASWQICGEDDEKNYTDCLCHRTYFTVLGQTLSEITSCSAASPPLPLLSPPPPCVKMFCKESQLAASCVNLPYKEFRSCTIIAIGNHLCRALRGPLRYADTFLTDAVTRRIAFCAGEDAARFAGVPFYGARPKKRAAPLPISLPLPRPPIRYSSAP